MKRLANPSQSQLIALSVLLLSVGAVFGPPLQVAAQPPEKTNATDTSVAQATGVPQPLATPLSSSSAPTNYAASSGGTTRSIGTITGQGTAGYLSKFTGTNAITNSVLFENSGKIGLGTTTPSGLFSAKSTSASVYPIYSLSVGNAIFGSSSGGIGVYGQHTNTTGDQSGVLGETSSTSANAAGMLGTSKASSAGAYSAGVRGVNLGRGTAGFGVYGIHAAAGIGVYGLSPSGNGVWGESTNGIGVHGRHTSTSGTTPAILGESNSTAMNAAAVQGVITSTTPGSMSAAVRGINNGTNTNGYGVYGSHAGTGSGVYGTSDSGTGTYGQTDTGDGVLGLAGTGTGVYGYSDSGYGGYFVGDVRVQGDLTVTGNLSKFSGSFKIDHPLHPSTEYLSHSFVESPDMMNVYNGNIITNGKGEAWVTLPNYFQALNRDFRYQLTPIGQFAQAIVGQKIKGNHFLIRTDKPNVEVSWQVTGIRQDAYARAHRIAVEETKTGADQGKYLYPAGFGAGQEKQIGYRAPRLATR
ncbi:hypothetical protein IAD21_04029 [Abditibacteriota bacterium]|nr:hypothetical protein IAD21_04029 [Abditibacteriota bacterium]